jgi:C4-dicarboxylate-specific signal transduction histidine kinase
MNRYKPSRPVVYKALLVAASLLVGFCAVQVTQAQIESNFTEMLTLNAQRQADEITSITVNGNVMGATAALGLIHQPVKSVARGELPLDDPSVVAALGAIGSSYADATGVYMVMPEGLIGSNWYPPGGKPLTGSVVKFRPYFQLAMQGKKNVYVAVGTTTGVPALYFSAPLYSEATPLSSIIGATVVRINTQSIQSILNAWTSGPALLLSPQSISLLSNQPALNNLIATEPSAQALKEIKALKQFGSSFEKGVPKTLPFDIQKEVVSLDGRRYALARAPVHWDDPLGPWTLLLLGDLDSLMRPTYKSMVGLAGFSMTLMLGWLGLYLRKYLIKARTERLTAITELQTYTSQLEAESEFKNYASVLANALHQALSHADFAQRAIAGVVQRVTADYAALYVFNEHSQLLVPLGGYGVRRQDLLSVALGEGLIGQCAKGRQVLVFESAQDLPIQIVWGHGAISPRSVLILPLVQMNDTLGVLVIASAAGFKTETQDEIKALLDTLSIQLGILNRNLANKVPLAGATTANISPSPST